MKRNCNLELRLLPLFPVTDRQQQQQRHPSQPMMNDVDGSLQQEQQQQQQKLSLFYDGNICVSDVTELQARAILRLASKEMDMARGERTPTPTPRSEPSSPTPAELLEYSLYDNNQVCSPSSGLSMKRSLQRFLQKRKNRIQDGSPY